MIELRWKRVDEMYPNSIPINVPVDLDDIQLAVLQYREWPSPHKSGDERVDDNWDVWQDVEISDD